MLVPGLAVVFLRRTVVARAFPCHLEFCELLYHVRFLPELRSGVVVQLSFGTDKEEDHLPPLQQIAQAINHLVQALGTCL